MKRGYYVRDEQFNAVVRRRKVKITSPHRFSNDVPSLASDYLEADANAVRPSQTLREARYWSLRLLVARETQSAETR